MKKKISMLTAACLLAVAGPLVAQDEEQDSMDIYPVETWTCNYNEGKGPADLDAAAANWNKWMDAEGVETYGALTVTPWYFGAETFDVGWIGWWPDGATMGAGTDMYLSEGGDAAAGFSAAVTCDSHANFATTMIKSPGDGPAPDSVVLYFSDCNIRDGAEWNAVLGGLRAWGDYMTEQEYGNGVWIMFPAFGSGDMKFDFKSVTSYANHAAAGTAYDKYANGGGWQKRMELLGDKLDCDVSRVYNATFRRNMPEGED